MSDVPDTCLTPPERRATLPSVDEGRRHGPEGDDDGRAQAGGAVRGGAGRGERGGGVPAPRDLPGHLLPLPEPVPQGGAGGTGGPVSGSLQLSPSDRPRARGTDLPDAQAPPPVGGPADPGPAGPLGDRPARGLHRAPGPEEEPPGGPAAPRRPK